MSLLQDDEWQRLMEGLVEGKYQLLLGSGASRDATDSLGRRLPTGHQLRDELLEAFSIPAPTRPDEKPGLDRVYKNARDRSSKEGLNRTEWLARRFTDCTPPGWYALLQRPTWRCIWSLNIDDALENSYGDSLIPVHFADLPVDPRPGKVLAVHLHGMASRPDSGLVFDLQEYAEYVTTPRSWPIRFHESLSTDPVIVLGAALVHEIDLARSLEQRAASASDEFPSIAVMPKPNELDRSDFERWNIELIDATAEEFLRAIERDWDSTALRLSPTDQVERHVPPSHLSFLHQWSRITREDRRPHRWHDFYGGDEPSIVDIARDLPAKRAMTSTLIEWAKSGEQPILVYGEPFSGKSTMVLRAVFDLEKEGWLVYEFNRRSRPDNSAVLQRVEDVPKTVLVVEGARDFESDLKNLAISAKERKLALRLLMIERKGAADRLLQSGLFHAIRVPAVVAEDEMMDLLAKLRDKGRLLRSASRGKSLPALLSHVSRAYNRVLSQTLANLVLGTGFQERVSHDYRALADPAVKSAFVLAAIVAAGGNSLPLGVAAEAVHLSGRALEKRMEVDQSLYSICYIRRGFLRPRHRLYGELLLGGVLAHRELYGPTIALATALAPFVTREAIRRRSIYHRIVRHLMDHNVLAGLIGRERIEGWYAELEGIYGWNARFWEQRALAASEEQVDDRAMQYALIAVDRYEDAYTLNTLATVRLRPIKRGRGPLKSTENVEFWEAVKDLERARERAAPDSEHPYVTFFDGAIGYGRRWRHSGADLPNALRVEWQAWWTAAQSSESFQHAKGHQALADFQRRWLELAPAPSAPTVDQPTNPTPDTSFLEGQ